MLSKKSFYTSSYFLNKPILQLECTKSRKFLPLYSIKRMGNTYRSVTQWYHLQFSCFGIQSTDFCYQPLVSWSEYCVLMHCERTYRLQMWIKMQHRVFKMSNTNPLSLWFTFWLLKGVDHKNRRLAGLIAFSSLLLILNMLCRILIHIWSW